jgi:NAD(P)-dependent dehydrogenase (short-subunit alcohol dehydrogenase family)
MRRRLCPAAAREKNLIGTFRCISKAAAGVLSLPPLDDGERAVIINTASVAAEDRRIGRAGYSAPDAEGAAR